MKITSVESISGRSILEMLGVLAIIGVLTLTALWGYPYMITKHRANQIITNVIHPQIILTLAQKNIGVKEPGILSFDVDTKPYENYVSFALEKTQKGNIKISLQKVAPKLCKELVENLLPEGPSIQVFVNETNRGIAELCALDENIIDIYFPDDMTLPNPDTPCGNNPCGENFVCDAATNTCVCNQLLDSSGQCLSCTTSANIQSTQSACSKCSQREYVNGVCSLPCKNGEIRGDDATCHTCSGTAPIKNIDQQRCLSCIGKRFWNVSAKTCWSCDEPNEYPSDKNLGCSNCPSRFFGSTNNQDNLCINCNTSKTFSSTKEECNRCGNKRFYIVSTGLCIKYPDCGPNQFLDNMGKCHSCDETGYIATGSEECFKCANRYSTGDTCGRCDDMQPGSNADQENCGRCPDTAYTNEKCYPCQSEKEWDSSKEECAKCPNRVYSESKGARSCHLPCEPGMLYSATAKKCISCSQTDGITTVGKEDCLTCSGQRFWNVGTSTCWSCDDTTERRSDEENGCHGCSNRFLRSGTKGAKADYCAPCNLNSDVYAPEANCNRCPSRFYRASDGLCLKPCASGKIRQPDGTCS